MDEIEMNAPNPKEKCKEIYKLHQMLEEAEIQHEFVDILPLNPFTKSDRVFCHLLYPSAEDYERALGMHSNYSNEVCSVIEGNGTYGYEQDLLEIRGLLTPEEERYDSVRGYLTAENVFERIKAAEERRKELFRHVAPTDTDYLVEEED